MTGASSSHLATQAARSASPRAGFDGGTDAAADRSTARPKKPPNSSRQITITQRGQQAGEKHVWIGTRAITAYMISGTDGASSTPSALALVTRPMPRCSG